MQLRSIKTKTLLIFLPALLITVIAISAVVFLSARALLLQQTETGIKEQLENVGQSIQKRILSHGRVPETTAKSVQSHYSKLTLDDYDAIVKNTLSVNPDTFGVGIFFEPNAYNAKTKYFSSYAYHDQSQIQVTHDYSDPKYDYTSQDWYKIAVNQKEVKYSDPYYDDTTKTSMLTASVPMYDDNQRFIGVATGDINLNTIQQIITGTKVGESGWAFLLDKNGTYLAGPDTDKIMKGKLQEDKDPVLAALGRALVSDGADTASYQSAKGLTRVYTAKVPQTGWIIATALPDQELQSKINSLMNKITAIGLAGLLLIALLIWLYTRNIAGHTERVNDMAGRLAKGDFTYAMKVTSKDEFGRMAENLNQTSGMLRDLMAKVSGHALHVASTSEQLSASAAETSTVTEHIASTIQEVAIGAETQLRAAEESARALEELAAGIQRVAESSSNLYEVSHSTSEQAVQGNAIIQQAVRDMDEANRTVTQSAALMEQLRARSLDVGGIINVISGISMQTNLLSLNAGIEAARAGEHGKGFAVVASEIRKLAEQTKQSAERVTEIVEEIQGQTAAAVESVETGTKAVESGKLLVERAGQAFTGIVAELQGMVNQIQEVSAASEEMSAGSQQVGATVEELARISGEAAKGSQNVAAASEEQLASMEEISASSQSLSAMVQELQDLLGQFKV